MQSLLEIIHEDSDLLVVHKPAGLVCHPTKGDEYSSLVSRVRLYLRAETNGGPPTGQPARSPAEPRLIHRLDRETSGVVLIAKNAVAAAELGKLWEMRAVRKEYLAIVHGHVADDLGTIDAPLGKDAQSPVAIKDCVRPDGRAAQTEFAVEKRFLRRLNEGAWLPGRSSPGHDSGAPFSLLRLRPLTGRKHQIRIHLSHVGHPVVGDKIYGGNPDLYLALVEGRLTADQRAQLILPYQALHASRLQFEWRGRRHDFQASPGGVFADFLGVPV